MKPKQEEYSNAVEIFVKPNSNKFKITNDGFVVLCKEQPIEGKVNKELLKEFLKVFHAKVELVSGLTSRQKILLITGVSKGKVEKLLCTK